MLLHAPHLHRVFFAIVLTVLIVASGSSAFTITSVVAPPPNDDFANAQPILGSSGLVLGTNVGATREVNEPLHANREGAGSVWYRWQAPSSGKFAFTTFGSSFATLLAVYRGNAFPLLPIASNVDQEFACDTFPGFSGLSFDAVGGIVYYIAVDQRTFSTSGPVRLRWGRAATISGRITDVSTVIPVSAETVQLVENGHCYRRSEALGGLVFTNVPTGANYSVNVFSGFSAFFVPYPGNPSISPLTGSVSNLNFYQISPTRNISGKVTMPGNDTTGLTVTCVSTPGALVTQPASDLGDGKYQCAGLPIHGVYIITPAKLGFSFTPDNRNSGFLNDDLFFINFTGAAAAPHTISGRVTDATGSGMNGVSLSLSGSQSATSVTDVNGNYSLTGIPHGGNYTVTPSSPNLTFTPTSLSFNNLSSDQLAANFTAFPPFQLILDDNGQVAALNSMLLTRGPFPLLDTVNVFNIGSDRSTRLSVFLADFQLLPAESPASVIIHLIDSGNKHFDIPAEAVVPLSVSGFTQVTFQLPDEVSSGICTVVVEAHGQTSNAGVIRIK